MDDTLSDLPTKNGDSQRSLHRANSISQVSEHSQTAQDFISSQLQLEAEAREALPYQFDTCTRPLGPLRQLLFSCLTCNPPEETASDYTPAGVCYSCSISCHGEHTLVELFNKRNFVCDCGSTRMPATSPCTLRADATGAKGNVHSELGGEDNKYNQNFRNRFCGCGEDYNPHQEKGTMFQCIGLGTVEEGGCGEDWWHPECLVGLPRGWHKKQDVAEAEGEKQNGDVGDESVLEEEPPLPPGFPSEDDFDGLVCYKCVEAFPWIKRYAGTTGFLAPVMYNPPTGIQPAPSAVVDTQATGESRKRKSSPDEQDDTTSNKRQRSSSQSLRDTVVPEQTATSDLPSTSEPAQSLSSTCRYNTLPPAPPGTFSLCLTPSFRDSFCRCPTHFPLLSPHPQLLDEEETYEPPISESSSADDDHHGGGSVGSRSLLDRGEAALSNVDRVRAIEGVMVYNHLKDKVKDFLKPFAESGKVVAAEDIKAYFETLRGDAEAIRAVRAEQGGGNGGEGEGDGRREQGGY